jgi:hypothetical protein
VTGRFLKECEVELGSELRLGFWHCENNTQSGTNYGLGRNMTERQVIR